MLERYSFALPKGKIIRRYGVKVLQMPELNYNISPGNLIPAIRDVASHRLELIRWGMDLKKNKLGRANRPVSVINASVISNADKPASLLLTQRCLIPADAFYCWRRLSRKSYVPFRISLKWNLPFAFAGVWQTEADESGNETITCALITTTANTLLAPLAATMPVILPLEEEKNWLAPQEGPFAVKYLFSSYPSDQMKLFPVSSKIHDLSFNSPLLTQPAQPVDQHGNYVLFGEQ